MKNIFIANWKMNPESLSKALRLAKSSDKKNVVLCPPFIYLNEIKKNLKNAKLGAQDIFWEKEGAFTGEISSLMIKNIGCSYVIIGHSERRNILNESDKNINDKIKITIKNKLKPIVCVGETKKERESGIFEKVIKNQLKLALRNIDVKEIIIAYEPIWAIGTKNACDFKKAEEVRVFIKKTVKEILKIDSVLIMYGGSVNSQNYIDYIKKASFNGLLIGGASLKEGEIKKIIKD